MIVGDMEKSITCKPDLLSGIVADDSFLLPLPPPEFCRKTESSAICRCGMWNSERGRDPARCQALGRRAEAFVLSLPAILPFLGKQLLRFSHYRFCESLPSSLWNTQDKGVGHWIICWFYSRVFVYSESKRNCVKVTPICAWLWLFPMVLYELILSLVWHH